ncbi:MAG: DMT family transporter [Elusimicrobium sp.]|jgi:drug/metabolite transporter (DMT)-like permease|nr:DMT family transporter [Elusimicrobium sp.]
MSPYLYALFSNITFGLGAQIFTLFSRRISPVWMTVLKGAAGCVFFFITIMLTGGFSAAAPKYIGTFFLSGFIGLGIADILLLKSFADLGPARTILLYGFQPLIIGVLSFFIFGQTVNLLKFCSIIFFLVCIFIFALESFRRSGHWSVRAMTIAFFSMVLDSVGIIITRYSFNGSDISALQGNFYRTLGAVACFFIISAFFNVNFWGTLAKMRKRDISLAALGSFLGVYLALVFYLVAIKTGNLAAVTAISVTGAIFAAVFECVFERKRPSKYLLSAFVFFAAGMYILLI